MRRWTKIFTIGDKYTEGIFDGPVSITEKVDGSQVNFGYNEKDGLWILSKGSTCHLGDNNKLFHPAVEHIHKLHAARKLPAGWSFHGETLHAPRQNTLVYNRVPKNHIALYGVAAPDGSQIHMGKTGPLKPLPEWAEYLDIEVVPEFFTGVINPAEVLKKLEEWLDRESFLGGQKIEGVVIKNYAKECFIGGQLLPLMQAKFVSEAFKEKHKVAWPENNKSPLVAIGDMVRTPARWHKAIQKLVENGTIEYHPRDIGAILKNLHLDVEEEDKEDIKEQLYKAFSKDIKRAAVRGLPEAYKVWLVERMSDPEAQIKLNIGPADFKAAGFKMKGEI